MTGRTLAYRDTSAISNLSVAIATLESSRIDAMMWDPEQGQHFVIECKNIITLGHDLCHLVLDDYGVAGAGQGSLAWSDDRSTPNCISNFEQKFLAILASVEGVSFWPDEASRAIRPGEPAWLSWTRAVRRPLFDTIPTPLHGIRAVQLKRPTLTIGEIRQAATVALYGLSVTFRTTQLALDYKAGQVSLTSGIIACMRFEMARLVSVLMHQSEVPAFLLVMIATARHYGHRGEPDEAFPVSAANPSRWCGVACLVA